MNKSGTKEGLKSNEPMSITSTWKPPPKGYFKINFDVIRSQRSEGLVIMFTNHYSRDIYSKVIQIVSISIEIIEFKEL